MASGGGFPGRIIGSHSGLVGGPAQPISGFRLNCGSSLRLAVVASQCMGKVRGQVIYPYAWFGGWGQVISTEDTLIGPLP